jgi:hypothetical protein
MSRKNLPWHLFLFPALLLFCVSLSAQQKGDTIITQIITFESPSTIQAIDTPKSYKKNSIGMGLLSWIEGYLPFYYERQIFKFLSLKVGAGLTFRSFTNDLGLMIWDDGKSSDYFTSYYSSRADIADHYANYTFRKASVGYYFAFAPKFYLHGKGMHGFNLYPMVEYKHFAFKAKLAQTDVSNYYSESDKNLPRSEQDLHEKMDCIDLTINVGGHFQRRNHVFFEWRVGAGMRKSYSTRLDVGMDENDNLVNIPRSYQKIKPVITTDIIVGGLF